jgi:Fe-S cluster biogenesis protein NfuA
LVDVTDGIVQVRLAGACGAAHSMMTLQADERMLKTEIPKSAW